MAFRVGFLHFLCGAFQHLFFLACRLVLRTYCLTEHVFHHPCHILNISTCPQSILFASSFDLITQEPFTLAFLLANAQFPLGAGLLRIGLCEADRPILLDPRLFSFRFQTRLFHFTIGADLPLSTSSLAFSTSTSVCLANISASSFALASSALSAISCIDSWCSCSPSLVFFSSIRCSCSCCLRLALIS